MVIALVIWWVAWAVGVGLLVREMIIIAKRHRRL
jgi:hypothetical protein